MGDGKTAVSTPLGSAESDTTAVISARARLVDALVLQTVLVLSWLVWLVPWQVWHAGAFAVGTCGMGFRWRRIVLANVRHARSGIPTPAIIAWYLGAQQIATHLRTVIGTLRGGARRPTHDDGLKVVGFEHLLPFLGQRGVIVVAPHAGPYPSLALMSSRWLRQEGYVGELAIVARLFRPFRSGALMQWFIDCFGRAGVTIIPVDEPPQRMSRRLRHLLADHGIVVLLVDEPTPTPSAFVPFFDSEIKLPLGPARLARATGSVIVPCIATYGRAGRVTFTISPPIEPARDPETTLREVGAAIQELLSRHLDQWAMLTPVWASPPATALPAPAPGHAYADLHLHTPGSDGLCGVADWVAAADRSAISLVAVTDHDHLATIRDWRAIADPDLAARVLPGVELTARGRAVHLGVLFPEVVPDPTELPKPGTPLPALVRWARTVPGSVVILVHPLPFIWRRQLRGLAAAGLLPDAIETRFPFVGWRSPEIAKVAAEYGLAPLGGSDAHLTPGQLGQHVTSFPGATAADLVAAIRAGTTRPVTRPSGAAVPFMAVAWQNLFSWLLPFARFPGVAASRGRILGRAQRAAGVGLTGKPDSYLVAPAPTVDAAAVAASLFPPTQNNPTGSSAGG